MSASYVHRDALILSPGQLQSRTGGLMSSNDFLPATHHHHHHGAHLSSRDLDNHSSAALMIKSNLTPPSTQVSLQSPKMSPDSTALTPLSSSSAMSRFPSNTSSPGLSSMFHTPPPTLSLHNESFLRSALTTATAAVTAVAAMNSEMVGSSTGGGGGGNPNLSIKMENPLSPMTRPRAMTTSNVMSPRCTTTAPTPSNTSAGSNPQPSSTTPVKKSSRRNPWGSETYSDLITVAIQSYPDHQATLQQIYDFIVTHYEYFRERSDPTSSAGWKNSIRHNLSLHDRFTKCPKSSDNTKSSYWRINTEVASKPYVRRRACSIDATNLKRPSECGKPGSARGPGSRGQNNNRGHSLLAASVRKAANTAARSAVAMSTTCPTPLPSLCELQCPPLCSSTQDMFTGAHENRLMLTNPQSGLMNHALASQHFGGGKMMPGLNGTGTACSRAPSGGGYFPYQSGDSDDLTECCNSDNGGSTRWAKLTTLSPQTTGTRTASYTAMGLPSLTSTLSGSYQYEMTPTCGNGNGTLFDTMGGFHPVSGASTDQTIARSRASSLIEHLLRSDNNLTHPLDTNRRPPMSSHMSPPQSYLPNAFLSHSTTRSGPSRGEQPHPADLPTTLDYLTQPHPVDMRPQSACLRASSPSALTPHDVHPNSTQHHLRPVHMQSVGGHLIEHHNNNAVPMSGFPLGWQSYAARSAESMDPHAIPPSSLYSCFSPFAAAAAVAAAAGVPAPSVAQNAGCSSSASSSSSSSSACSGLATFRHSGSDEPKPDQHTTYEEVTPASHAVTRLLPLLTNSNGDTLLPPVASPSSRCIWRPSLEHMDSRGHTNPTAMLYYNSPSACVVGSTTDSALDTPPHNQQQPLIKMTEEDDDELSNEAIMCDAPRPNASTTLMNNGLAPPNRLAPNAYCSSQANSRFHTASSTFTASHMAGLFENGESAAAAVGCRMKMMDSHEGRTDDDEEDDDDDDDSARDQLELELSLELADRIVGSVQSVEMD